MLSKYVKKLCDTTMSAIKYVETGYKRSQASLKDHVSLRPRDIMSRSFKTANWATLIVIGICYPVLYFYRGLDVELFLGMIVHYATLWLLVMAMVTGIQFIWLINYCISQRFVENMLDFEILDRVFGQNQNRDQNDISDFEDEDLSDNGMKRASG